MIKYVVLVMASIGVAACSAHDGRYYSLHPNALQKAIKQCPQTQPKGVSCTQLKTIAVRVNELAYQLRSNSQGYGKKILNLQETIAKQEAALQNGSHQLELQASIHTNKHDLEEYLAIVKWLESPEG